MALSIGRTRIIVHPLALLYPLAACMLGAGMDALALMIALTVHEGAHLLAAQGLGIGIARMRLTPFGAAMDMDNLYGLSPLRLLAVAVAGPLSNAFALLTTAALTHWRMLSPAFALVFIQTNLALLAFNLLPALPLDGGRMAYALLSLKFSRERALSFGIWMGRAVAVALLCACVALALQWRRVNLSFIFAAVFIWASAADERQALADTKAKAVLGALRRIDGPMPARLWAVSADCAAQAALRVARPDALTLYAVYKDNRLSSITDDRRLLEIVLARGSDGRVRDATARPHPPGRAS